MPVLSDSISQEGALVDVEVGLARIAVRALQGALRPVPPGVTARAVIDTGAECCCIDVAMAQALGLIQKGFTLINAPAIGGLPVTFQYSASLTILHPSGDPRGHLVVPDLPILVLSLSTLNYQVLLGRDVLARCQFHYDGGAGTFQLSY